MERLVPVYHKTKVIGPQSFLRGKFAAWVSNGIAWRKFGNVLRKQSSRVSIVLSHMKF